MPFVHGRIGIFFQGRNRIQFFLLVWSGPGFSSPTESATLSITAFPRILSTVSMIITIQFKLGMLHVRYIYCMLAISGVLNFFFIFNFIEIVSETLYQSEIKIHLIHTDFIIFKPLQQNEAFLFLMFCNHKCNVCV